MRSLVTRGEEVAQQFQDGIYHDVDGDDASDASSDDAHFYHTNKPQPTAADIEPMKSELAEKNMGGNWIFAKTLFQNADFQLSDGRSLHRIVHLFLRVD